MRKLRFIATAAVAAAVFFFSNLANADLCIVKSGTYTGATLTAISKTSPAGTPETVHPCAAAAIAAGKENDSNGNPILEYEFGSGADIVVDLIFDQSSTLAQQFVIENFVYELYYNADPASEVGCPAGKMCDISNDAVNTNDKPFCSPDPAQYFKDSILLIDSTAAFCAYGNNYTANNVSGASTDTSTPAKKIVTQSYINFSGNNFPEAPGNFILDTITFANKFGNGDTYGGVPGQFDFVPAEFANEQTDINVNDGTNKCNLLNATKGGCAALGVVAKQKTYTTRVKVVTPPCFVGPPGAATVTCDGDPGCDGVGADPATVSLTYAVPTTCYNEATCTTTTACLGTPEVVFTSLAAAEQRLSAGELSGNKFTEASTVGTLVSYTIGGDDGAGGCQPSTATTCANKTRDVSITCQCGDPPTAALNNPTNYGDTSTKTWLQGQDVTVEYAITDPDGSIPTSIGNATFYITIDIGVAPMAVVFTDLTASYKTVTVTQGANSFAFQAKLTGSGTAGTLSIVIPGDLVNKDIDIIFGLIVQDGDGLSAKVPGNFDPLAISPATTNLISGANIIPGTKFWFLDGEAPYPNQFPFRASTTSVLKVFFSMNCNANVTMRIYSLDGMLVRQIENSSQSVLPTEDMVECTDEACNFCNWATGCQWDGTSYRGGNDLVGNGMYIVNLHANCTDPDSMFYGASLDYTKGIVVMK